MNSWLRCIVHKEKYFFFMIPAFVWQFFFLYIPIALMVMMSFLSHSPLLKMQFLSLALYRPFLTSTYFLILINSLVLACVNGILCFLIGYPVAFFIAFNAGRFKNIALFLLIVPFWTNFLLHVYAWFFVLDQGGIVNSILLTLGIISEPLYLLNSMFAIILLMVYCYLPFMVLPIYSALERFDTTLLEASRDLGASGFETWYHIVMPLSMSGVLSGFLLVFVPSFGEFAIPSLMGGDKYLFAGSIIAQYALGHNTMALGMSFTVISLLFVIVLIGMGILINRLFIKRLTGLEGKARNE